MKSTLLGILYGLGKNSLAERINTTPDEAERIIETVFKTYPQLKPYIEGQQAYPFSHDGKVNTMFGDILVPPEWKYYQEAQNQKEKRNLEARLKRLAVNLPINLNFVAHKSDFMKKKNVNSKEVCYIHI